MRISMKGRAGTTGGWTKFVSAIALLAAALLTPAAVHAQGAQLRGALPQPLPLLPADNWWNLDISAAPVDGGDVVAAPWVPHEVSEPLVWAALDCPGAIAVGWDARGVSVLGRMAADVQELPRVGEQCVVVAQPLGEDGRKLYAATALYGEDGRLLGRARQTWITPRE